MPWLTICSSRPLRSASSWVTTPTYSSGRSIAHPLERLVQLPVDLAGDHLGLADGQLEALPPHQLDQHRERQLAAALDLPDVRAVGVAGRAARRCRRARASSRSLTWLAVSLSPSLPGERRVLMPIVTESDGSSTVMTGSGRGSSASASVSPIVISGMPATEMISPAPASSAVDAVERLGHIQLGDLDALDRPIGAAPRDRARRARTCRCGSGRSRSGRRRGTRRGWSRAPGAGAPGRTRGPGCARAAGRAAARGRSPARLGRGTPGRPWRCA